MKSKKLGKLRPLHGKPIKELAGSKRKLIPFLDKKLEFVLINAGSSGHDISDNFENVIENFLNCESVVKESVAQTLFEFVQDTKAECEIKPSSVKDIWEYIRMWNVTINQLGNGSFYACIMCGLKSTIEDLSGVQINFRNGNEFEGVCDQTG